MLLPYCPLLVAQRRCRLKPHKVSSDRRSIRGPTEPTDSDGPHRRDWRHRDTGIIQVKNHRMKS